MWFRYYHDLKYKKPWYGTSCMIPPPHPSLPKVDYSLMIHTQLHVEIYLCHKSMIEDCMSKYLPCDKSNNKDESNHIQRQQSCYLISVYLKLALRK